MIPVFTSAYLRMTGCFKLCFHYFIQNILQKSSVCLTILLVPEPVRGPRESAMTVRPVGGAAGPSDVSIRPPDDLKAANLFLSFLERLKVVFKD